MVERNQFAMDTFKTLKTDIRNQARLSNGKLFVKGQVRTEFLEPKLPEADPAGDEPVVTDSQAVRDLGSTFQGYASSARSLPEVTSGLNQIITLPDVCSTSHVIYAYRIELGDTVCENFQSDDDHGM